MNSAKVEPALHAKGETQVNGTVKAAKPAKRAVAGGAKRAASKPSKAALLEGRLLSIVEAQRQLGGSSYPVQLQRLAELADESVPNALKAVQAAERKSTLLLSLALSPKTRAQRLPRAVVLLPADQQTIASSEHLLQQAMEVCRAAAPRAYEAKEVALVLNKKLSAGFLAALKQRSAAGKLPEGVGAVPWKKGAALYFSLEDAIVARQVSSPSASAAAAITPPEPDAAQRFQAAFNALDQETGGRNYVLLHALRRALPDLSRAEFDATLMELRRARRFTLDAAEGRHERLTPEELDAGITEAGNLLVYVARRAEA